MKRACVICLRSVLIEYTVISCGLYCRSYMCAIWCVIVILFQAEDGIRDLVRSRGLGDVYKRQPLGIGAAFLYVPVIWALTLSSVSRRGVVMLTLVAVSYTHLTLPTSDLV